MRRVISVFLNYWATDRLRRNADAPLLDVPLVIVAQEKNRRVLSAIDANARALGLRVGMTAAHAQSLVPNLTLRDATPGDDESALIKLSHWCSRYSPLVTPDPPDGVFIDVAGASHLFKGEAALLEDLSRRLQAFGISSRVALADTPGCAWAVARFGGGGLIATGRVGDALGSLPITCLRVQQSVVESLADVGIERVAQLASKQRASIQTRFGREVLNRLDYALGTTHEALASLQPPEVPQEVLKFVEPIVDPENLARVIENCAIG